MNNYLANNPAVISYQAGTQYNVQFDAANTGAATLQFNGLAAIQIVKSSSAGNVPLAGGEIAAGATMALIYGATGYAGGPAFILAAAVPVIPPHSLGAAQMAGDNNANLVPDAGFQFGTTYWNLAGAGAMAIARGVGGGGQNGLELAGGGAPSANLLAISGAIPATPSATMMLSGYVDARGVSSGSPQWLVMDAARTSTYASAVAAAGSVGRVNAAAFVVPAGVTSLVVIFSTENCTVASGFNLIAAAAQLELGATVTQYKPSVADSATGYLPPGAAAIDFSSSLHSGQVQPGKLAAGAATSSAAAAWSGSQSWGRAFLGPFENGAAIATGGSGSASWETISQLAYNRALTMQANAGSSFDVLVTLNAPKMSGAGASSVLTLVALDNAPRGIAIDVHYAGGTNAWSNQLYYWGIQPSGMNSGMANSEGVLPSITIGVPFALVVPNGWSADVVDKVQIGIVAQPGQVSTVAVLNLFDADDGAAGSYHSFSEWFSVLELPIPVLDAGDLVNLYAIIAVNAAALSNSDSVAARIIDENGNVIVEPQTAVSVSSSTATSNLTMTGTPLHASPAAPAAGNHSYTLQLAGQNGSGDNGMSATLTAAQAWGWDARA